MKRGVAPWFVQPWSLLAPASSNKSIHLRLPLRAAAYSGVIWFASWKFGLRGLFNCCASSVSSFCSHATMMVRSCSASGGRNSSFTRCTTCIAKFWSSSSEQLSWRSRSRNRGRPIFSAKRCFNAFTEASAISSSSNTAIDSPVTAESTSSMGLRESTSNQKAWISNVTCWNILNQKLLIIRYL